MCGRNYSTYTDEELQFRYLNRKWPLTLSGPVSETIPSFKPNYNMCPTQTGLVFAAQDGKLSFSSMRWGLVPGWAKTVKDADKYSMINAKAEEIAEKRSYKSAFQKRRCIVPVSGFFEWKREGEEKRPFAISLKEDPIMILAGIWEHWESKETGEVVESFSLITTASNTFMSEIHTRMPVILNREQEEKWIDPDMNDPKALQKIMEGCPSEVMKAVEVSKLVNSPRNNSSEVLVPR